MIVNNKPVIINLYYNSRFNPAWFYVNMQNGWYVYSNLLANKYSWREINFVGDHNESKHIGKKGRSLNGFMKCSIDKFFQHHYINFYQSFFGWYNNEKK